MPQVNYIKTCKFLTEVCLTGPGWVRGLRGQRGSGRGMMSRRGSLNGAAATAMVSIIVFFLVLK